jgi:hypothetical protein
MEDAKIICASLSIVHMMKLFRFMLGIRAFTTYNFEKINLKRDSLFASIQNN